MTRPHHDPALVDDFLDGDPFMLASEVAPLFRVDARTVSRWAKRGRLPGQKTPGGGEWRFRESVIHQALSGRFTDGDQDR